MMQTLALDVKKNKLVNLKTLVHPHTHNHIGTHHTLADRQTDTDTHANTDTDTDTGTDTHWSVHTHTHIRGIVAFNFSPRNLSQVTSAMKPGKECMFGIASVKRITLREGLY